MVDGGLDPELDPSRNRDRTAGAGANANADTDANADAAPDSGAVMDALARRDDVLAAIGTGTVGKRDLADALPVSRSTVDRAIRELEGLGLVERAESGYRRTTAGTLAFAERERYVSRIRALTARRDLVETLPSDVDLDGALVATARVIRSDPAAPRRPEHALRDRIADATEVRLALVAALGPVVAACLDRAVIDGDVELLAPPEVAARLVADHADALERGLTAGGLDLRETPEPPAVGLATLETAGGRIAVALLPGDAGPHALLESDDPAAVARTEARLDDLRAAGERLTPPG